MGQLQYISSTNGTFSITSSTWLNQITSDCVIEYKFLSRSRTDVLDFGAVISGPSLTNGIMLKNALLAMFLQWYNGTRITVTNSKYTLNEPHILTLSGSEYKWDGETIASVNNIRTVNNPTFKPTINGNFYYFKVTKNGTDFINLVAWEENGVVGLKDLVSGTFYQPSSGTWIAGPPVQDDSNVVPINKYKLYTSNIQKTYNGSTQINKMYVGNDLVYRALPTTTPPHPIFIDYVCTTTESFVNTSIVPTTSTKFRVKFKTTALNGGVTIGYGPNTPISAGDSQDYRLFHHRGMNDFTFDFNRSRFYGYGTTDENGMYDLTCGNNYIYDNVAGATAGTGTTQSSIAANNVPIYIDLRNSHQEIHQVTIYSDNDTVVFDGHAAELNGVYGIYDTVSGQLLQPTDGATVYGGTWQ